MLKREVAPPPEHLFPPDPWRIVEAAWSPRYSARAETAFALANGYLGVRGTLEEGLPALAPGTFVSGFHETWPIVHPEGAYGLASTGQTIVNVPDTTGIKLYVDDEPLFLPVARTRRYERVLDLRAGTLSRDLVWSTAGGKHVRVRSWRLVSWEFRHLMAMHYEVTVLDHPAPVVLDSLVVNRQDAAPVDEPNGRRSRDPRLGRTMDHRVLRCEDRTTSGLRLVQSWSTARSRMHLAVGVDHILDCPAPHEVTTSSGDDQSQVTVTVDAEPGVPIRLVKYATYHSSRVVPGSELAHRCVRTLDRAVRSGPDELLSAQRANLDRFWDRADVQVETDVASTRTQQAVRWNLFQLGQASWRAEGSGIGAKGLTSQAYDGHYFWDTETYVLPFLTHTQPRIARNLLRFRHGMLDQARARARQLDQRGALFPWRTIDGDEASANFQAGTAQYHINADIAFALRTYLRVRGDLGFVTELGAEVLVETARLWEDLGFYGDDGHFHIHGVTGPDEYTTVVNDNTYTNLMARLNLRTAAEVVRALEERSPLAHAALVEDVGLRPDEVGAWERAADAMHVPYDEQRGIHPQDVAFLDREVWDLEATPLEQFPLLLHHHPLVIYRFQVIKQADIVLAMFLLSTEFSLEQKRRNFDYYDPLTTGDSSLSACVQSIIAAEVGREGKALDYFRYGLLMDLADVEGSVSDGVHVASTAGVWMALVFGFGGLRDFDGDVSFDPRLPSTWRSLGFSLRVGDRQVRVHLTHDQERYEVEDGDPLDVTVRGDHHVLAPGAPLVVPARASRVRASARAGT
ncbi:MAG: glycoside hydrolase family 65 protein [Frankiales bacterium]|nr:glycoside hydrolase family 65 protein [Frankiales bacterium]